MITNHLLSLYTLSFPVFRYTRTLEKVRLTLFHPAESVGSSCSLVDLQAKAACSVCIAVSGKNITMNCGKIINGGTFVLGALWV